MPSSTSSTVPMLHPASGRTVEVDAQLAVDSLAAKAVQLHKALVDLLDWAEHIEGEGRLRRTEAIAQAREALA